MIEQGTNETSTCMCPHCSGVTDVELKVAQTSLAAGSKQILYPALEFFWGFSGKTTIFWRLYLQVPLYVGSQDVSQ